MNLFLHRSLFACLLILVSMTASAINKCESNGTTTYSEEACAKGKSSQLEELPPPLHAAEAKQEAEAQKLKLKKLENERKKREAKEDAELKKQGQANRAVIAKKKRCAALAQRTKWAQEDASSANRKSAEKKKLQARRAAEKYALECDK